MVSDAVIHRGSASGEMMTVFLAVELNNPAYQAHQQPVLCSGVLDDAY